MQEFSAAGRAECSFVHKMCTLLWITLCAKRKRCANRRRKCADLRRIFAKLSTGCGKVCASAYSAAQPVVDIRK